MPRTPGMTRADLFNVNASLVYDLAKATAENAPNANILVISNPVNSTVPIVAEVFKKQNVYNKKKLFGVTTLDSIRASRFISEIMKTDPTSEFVSVVGGHSGITIIPLLSQTKYYSQLTPEQREHLINRIQFGGDEVVKAKNGAGSATLSMAQAGANFADSVMKGLSGESNIVANSFVDSPLCKAEGIEFFASPVTLGKDGIEKIHDIGKINTEEENMLEKAKETLKKNIERGVEFVESKA